MTRPLAQQIAQVREALPSADHDPPCGYGRCAAHSALSAIERHLQDMETALLEIEVTAAGEGDEILSAFARAALPAREKGEE